MWRCRLVCCKFTYVSEKRASAFFIQTREETFILNFGNFSQGTICQTPATAFCIGIATTAPNFALHWPSESILQKLTFP